MGRNMVPPTTRHDANIWRFKCSSTNYQLRPIKSRTDYLEATTAFVTLAASEGQNVEYIPKEERHRTDALDPNLET